MSVVRWFQALDRQELVGVCIAATFFALLSFVPLAVSFAVSPADIDSGRVQLTPPCEYKATHGEPCVACGLTRGFSALSRGRVRDAQEYNHWSLPLYAAVWLTLLGSGTVLVSAVRRFRRSGRALA